MEKLGRRLAAAALLLGAAFLCVYPLLRPDFAASAVAAMPPRVMIDAGHGGKDAGAIGVDGSNEKTINLQIAESTSTLRCGCATCWRLQVCSRS